MPGVTETNQKLSWSIMIVSLKLSTCHGLLLSMTFEIFLNNLSKYWSAAVGDLGLFDQLSYFHS